MMLVTSLLAAVSTPEFNFMHYTTDNGLPSNCVRDIVQDSRGFIWFATDGGLVRFDGVRATTFLPDESVDVAQPNTYAMSIAFRGEQMITAISRHLFSFNPRLERLELLPLKYPKGMRHMGNGEVKDVTCGPDSTLWASVEGQGVFQIDKDLNVVNLHEFPELHDNMGRIYCDSHNNVWGMSVARDGGIYRLDRKSGHFVPFPIIIGGEAVTVHAITMFEDANGEYWLGTWYRGLIKFDPRTGEALRLPAPGKELIHIHSIMQYSSSRLLVGCDQGLALYDIPSATQTLYRPDELNRMSLSNQFVYPVVRDKEGGIWIGTFYGGVNYMPPDTKHIRHFNHSQFRNSVSGDVISTFAEDSKGYIWIGSDDGGLCRYNPVDETFEKYRLGNGSTPDNVHAISADSDTIWVGTYSAGAGMFDPATGRWNPVPLEGAPKTYSCYAIHKDKAGSVWMGGNDCLNRYDPEQGRFVIQRNLETWIVGIAEDSRNRLWISTQGQGVYLYNPYFDSWVNYASSLPHTHVNKVLVTADDEVYAATVNGVARFNEEKNMFEKLDIELPSNLVASIEKYDGYLWLSTAAGLVRWQEGGHSELFTTRDGLMTNEFASGSSLVTRDGTMYLGSLKGFSTLSPAEIKMNEFVPSIYFTQLEVVNREIPVGDDILPESLNEIDKLVLTHRDHTFSIYFAALSYANPDCNSYLYKLEGFDKDWISAGKDNRATYSNLPPGSYTLRVKASNNDGIWNQEGVSLKIEILPVWYASWWMRCIYLLLIVLGVVGAIRFDRYRKAQQHEEELARISSNKEKEVYRTKVSFFTIVAHEIRTPVSLIIGPLEKVMESAKSMPKEVRGDLDMIDRNAHRLLSLVNQMLDFKKAEESALPMEFHRVPLAKIVQAVAERFKPSLEHNGAVLEVKYPQGNLDVDICPEAFTKLVSNLLNNARKFTKDRVTLTCGVSPDGKTFTVSVEDNGIGIKRENLQKIFTPFYQIIDNINESRGGTGLGLSIVKSVAESHGGTVIVESELGKWSRFTATLPVRQAHVVPDEPQAEPEVAESSDVKTVAADSFKPLMLVVDDNVEMLSYISSSMSSRYEVMTAENGVQALEVLKQRSVQLIICDWMMPVMDGLTLLKEVRRNKEMSHIPFVMLTAKTDSASKIESMKQGADAYVEKPFSMSFLKARIDNLVDIRNLLKQKYSSDPMEPVTSLAPRPDEDEFLTRMNTLIEENVGNPNLSVDFLATELKISRTGLYAKIKTLADVTPNELIRIMRLKKAGAMIAEGKMTIAEISFATGFNSASYFAKCFQKQFGQTPSEFMEKVRSGEKKLEPIG